MCKCVAKDNSIDVDIKIIPGDMCFQSLPTGDWQNHAGLSPLLAC